MVWLLARGTRVVLLGPLFWIGIVYISSMEFSIFALSSLSRNKVFSSRVLWVMMLFCQLSYLHCCKFVKSNLFNSFIFWSLIVTLIMLIPVALGCIQILSIKLRILFWFVDTNSATVFELPAYKVNVGFRVDFSAGTPCPSWWQKRIHVVYNDLGNFFSHYLVMGIFTAKRPCEM